MISAPEQRIASQHLAPTREQSMQDANTEIAASS
jgi:hypothetical protein